MQSELSGDRGERELTAEQEAVLADSLAWLRGGWPLHVRKLDRSALYDDARDPGGEA